jgi:hypothetical protein
MSRSPRRRWLSTKWKLVLLGIGLNLLLLPVLAAPVALLVTWLIEVAHRFDGRIPALTYGAVWALVYAAGLVLAFMKLEIEFSQRN